MTQIGHVDYQLMRHDKTETVTLFAHVSASMLREAVTVDVFVTCDDVIYDDAYDLSPASSCT